MINLKNSLLFGSVFFLVGCSSIANYSHSHQIPKDGVITVLPFKNNSDTPLAGKKAQNIMETILVSKNRSVKISFPNYGSDEKLNNNIYKVDTRYYLQGSINEWRYKTGLDAEPTVAINFSVVDRTNGSVVYSAVGAKNGWGGESVGLVAQKLMLELTKN